MAKSNRKKTVWTLMAAFIAVAALMVSGCAGTAQFNELQEQVNANTAKIDQAAADAEEAKAAAGQSSADAEKYANQAKMAADEAEQAAQKSEAIFNQKMQK
ncbi:MAG: hypothetical protein KFF46_01480 [Desulfobacterales bacterium]|nr:hypothetical protein [Desulfobacterales bacterium]